MAPSREFLRLFEALSAHRAVPGVPVSDLRSALEATQGGRPLAEDITVQTVDANGVRAELVIPAECPVGERTILYLHGGGYVLGSLTTARPFAAALASAAQARVLSVDYRLAPEFTYPAAVEDSISAYRWLLGRDADTRQIVFCGDSAGGGLALATMVALRDAGLPLPAGCVCLSPWTDLSMPGESYVKNAERDPQVSRAMLAEMAASYAGTHSLSADLISPVNADLTGLPPLFIQVGDAEALLDDSLALSEHARTAGLDVTLHVWPDMIHVWPLFAPKLPEARAALDQVAAWLQSLWTGERMSHP
jgi:epsilon-lactone hydrolase